MPRLQEFGPDRPAAPDKVSYVFWCLGCAEHHIFTVRAEGRPRWSFNGNWASPSFSPSLLYPDKTPRCHLFLTAGRVQYLPDCGHGLAGQTIDLPEIPPDEVWHGATKEA